MIFYANSTNRVYNDNELNAINKLLFQTKGVFNTTATTHAKWEDSGDFKVTASGGNMTILADPGMATVEVTIDGDEEQTIIDESNQLSANVADNVSGATRNDAVVLRVDQSVITNDNLNQAGDNAVFLTVISGSDGEPLTDGEIRTALGGDPYVRLADIAVPASATEITNNMITDVRSRPQMTRSVDVASDSFTFYQLPEDPHDLMAGQVWYNSTEGILKFYDGENTIALQTQTFDWGYYPPSGVDGQVEIESVAENDSSTSVKDEVFETNNFDAASNEYTTMQAQLFDMPNVSQPFFRVKMGNPDDKASVKFRVYTVDANNEPDTLVEDLGEINYEDVPVNDYLDLFTSNSYTPGNTYMLIASSTRVSTDDLVAQYTGEVKSSSYDDNTVFSGIRFGELNSSTGSPITDPTQLNWSGVESDRQFVMSISDLSKQPIGETDSSGNFNEISQSFVAKSKDILDLRVIKGASAGSPTGFVKASLYEADENNDPSGELLASGTITESDWQAASDGDNLDFNINYDELVVGNRYVAVIETEDTSNSDNYRVYYIESTTGEARRFTTAEGWVDAGGDILLYTITSPIRKIVVTNDQGDIPHALIPKGAQVKEYTSTATPSVDVVNYDAVYISALTEAITGVSATGAAEDFQELKFRIRNSSGASQSITWGSQFEAGAVALPTSVASGNTLTVWFEYDAVERVWECIVSGSSSN